MTLAVLLGELQFATGYQVKRELHHFQCQFIIKCLFSAAIFWILFGVR